MQGLTESLSSFNDAGFRQAAFEQTLELNPATMSLPACLYFIWKTQACYLAGDYEEAVRAAAKARPLLWSAPSFQEIPDYYYFTALALAARYPVADAGQWRADLETMRAHQAKLRKCSESCPENFANKHALPRRRDWVSHYCCGVKLTRPAANSSSGSRGVMPQRA